MHAALSLLFESPRDRRQDPLGPLQCLIQIRANILLSDFIQQAGVLKRRQRLGMQPGQKEPDPLVTPPQ